MAKLPIKLILDTVKTHGPIFKEKITDISTNGLKIPISSSMIERLIGLKLGNQDVKVEITPVHLVLYGKTEVKKMMIKKNLSFRITLEPIQLESRTIQFKLVDMKPVNINFVSNKIFNKPPFIEYTEQTVKIDLNAWDAVKDISVGNIKSYEMVEGAINIKLSL